MQIAVILNSSVWSKWDESCFHTMLLHLHSKTSFVCVPGAIGKCDRGGRMCPEPGQVGIRGQGGGSGWFRGPCLDLWCRRGNNTYIMSTWTSHSQIFGWIRNICSQIVKYTDRSNNVQISRVTNSVLPVRCDAEVGRISILAVGRATHRRLEQICPYAHGDSCEPRGWRRRRCFGAACLRQTQIHSVRNK